VSTWCRRINGGQPLACIILATGRLALASSVIAGILWIKSPRRPVPVRSAAALCGCGDDGRAVACKKSF